MDCQRDTEARSPLQTQLFSLQGHTALVTGAGSGLGKYMAHALLHAGANLILVGRTLDRLEASADEIFLSLKQQGGHLAYDSDPAARSAHRDPDQNKRIACIAFDVSELKTLPELAQKQGRRSIWQRRGTWHRNMNVLYRAELRENERRKIWREI